MTFLCFYIKKDDFLFGIYKKSYNFATVNVNNDTNTYLKG